ncbi:MAG: tetratricopeptide repeat protein, partial [Flavobacteriales bacterium]|nr:tetratricopeptide repeat protein [Flavobacteriales bacterium]
MRFLFSLYSLLFLIPFSVYSQNSIEKLANAAYKNRNYIEAVEYYEKLLKSAPDNNEYLFKIGVSYLESNIDKKKATKYLERLYEIDSKSHDIWYYLALSYHHSLKIDKSLEFFTLYKPFATEERKALVDQHIRNCNSAKALMSQRINVTFENLGPLINSKYPDYYPFVAKDDSYLSSTSRRRSTTGGYQYFDGFYASDIMTSAKDTSGHYAKARKGGSKLNTDNDDQCVGLSDDGHTMFVYSNENKDGNIYKSFRKTKSFGKPEKLSDHINTKKLESAACISHDESVLFFSSNMGGGYGGLDLYM